MIAIPLLREVPNVFDWLDITFRDVMLFCPFVNLLFTFEDQHITTSINHIVPSIFHGYGKMYVVLSFLDFAVYDVDFYLFGFRS